LGGTLILKFEKFTVVKGGALRTVAGFGEQSYCVPLLSEAEYWAE
jgi:hypothetical protein